MQSPGDRVVRAGQPVEVRLSARDPERETVAYGARGLPLGARLIPEPEGETAVFQWIPLSSDALPGGRPHSVTFIAQDPHGGRSEARITLTVYADDTLPRFTSPRNFVLGPAELLDVILAVRDDDSTALEYALVAGPTGAALVPRPEGVRLTWRAPDAEAAARQAVYAFVVAVEDESGAAGRVVSTFHVLVESIPRP